MKITCGVEIINRAHPTKSVRNKITLVTLALCQKSTQKELQSEKDAFLILCTHQNPTEAKYKLYNNVEKLFTKFISDGKATLRFKEPPHDLMISKADPLQLKGFLNGVSLTVVGKGTGRIKLSEIPMKIDCPKKKQQKLVITKNYDYPVKAGFPDSLTFLQTQCCKLKKFDPRILQLQHLQVLDLAHNSIKEIPVALAKMKLKELILHHNELTTFPAELAAGDLGQSLKVLNLSHNNIAEVSPYFSLIKNMSVLTLNNNKLVKLPRNIQHLKSIRSLNISHNLLKVLPFGISKLRLDTFTFGCNPFDADVASNVLYTSEMPSLLELAASAVVKNDLPCTPDCIPSCLVDFIVKICPCCCGKRVFSNYSSSSFILNFNVFRFASTIEHNALGRDMVPVEVKFCSNNCIKYFDML